MYNLEGNAKITGYNKIETSAMNVALCKMWLSVNCYGQVALPRCNVSCVNRITRADKAEL